MTVTRYHSRCSDSQDKVCAVRLDNETSETVAAYHKRKFCVCSSVYIDRWQCHAGLSHDIRTKNGFKTTEVFFSDKFTLFRFKKNIVNNAH